MPITRNNTIFLSEDEARTRAHEKIRRDAMSIAAQYRGKEGTPIGV